MISHLNILLLYNGQIRYKLNIKTNIHNNFYLSTIH